MKNVNWSSYDKDALDFVFKESTKLLEETFKSFRESSNKSFIALAVYSGMLSYCFKEIVQHGLIAATLPYLISGLGAGISIICLWSNLMPKKMTLAGTKPDKLLHPFYEQESVRSNQVKEMMIARITDQDEAITENLIQVVSRSNRFRISVVVLLVSLLLGLAVSLV